MSYASLAKTLPEILRQPVGWSAMASVGIHGLLWLTMPMLHLSESSQLDSSRSVGLIELTPDEQSRLPKVNLSPSAPQSSVLPPVPPPAPFNAPEPALPPGVLPPLPVLPPPPLAYSPIPPPGTSIPVPNTPNNITPPPAFPPSQTFQPPPTSPLPNLKPSTLPQPNAPSTNPPPQQTATAQPTRQQGDAARPNKLPTRTAQELLVRREQLRRNSPANTTNPSNSSNALSAAAQAQRQAQLLARLRRANSGNLATPNNQGQPIPPNTAPQAGRLPERTRQQLLARREQLRGQIRTVPSTSAETAQRVEQLRSWSERQSRIQENQPSVVTARPVYDTICQKYLQGVVVLGVVVSPEGKIVSGPDILYKKGTGAIGRAARERIQAYVFPKTNSFINQQFNLQFTSDNGKCSLPTQVGSREQGTGEAGSR